LEQVSTDEFINPQSIHTEHVQEEFDYFYNVALGLLDRFYPERTINVRSRDPDYVTLYIKAQLRKKNRLMRPGRVEEAGPIAERIGKDIVKRNRTRVQKYNGRVDAKEGHVGRSSSVDRSQARTDG